MVIFGMKGQAQDTYVELGLGVGNVVGEEHGLGKGELHVSLFKPFSFGDVGLDLAVGGNLIPGERGLSTINSETLSPNDTRFGTIMLAYRLPVKEFLFIEPRLGYASLNAFVHTDNERKISQPNLSTGIGIGGTVHGLNISLRYQYLGKTAAYQGSRGPTLVISNPENVSLILLRFSCRVNVKDLF
jgi:hypothetical protein